MLQNLIASFAIAVAASAAPSSNLTVGPCDAGERMQFEVVECEIPLSNIGDKTIMISDAKSVSKNDSIDPSVTVPAHSTAYLKTKVAFDADLGYSKHSFNFTTSEPGRNSKRSSLVYAFVSTVLDQGNPKVDFGTIAKKQLPVFETLKLTTREIPDFRILKLSSKSEHVIAEIANDGHSLRIGLDKDAPLGIRPGFAIFEISGEKQKKFAVQIAANVEGNIVPDANPYALGLMRTDAKNTFKIRLSSRDKKDFKVGKVVADRVKADADVGPCSPASEGCKVINLTIANDQQQGPIAGEISVPLPDEGEILPIRVSGLLLDPKVEVHNLNKEMEAKQASSGAGASSKASLPREKLDLSRAIEQKVESQNEKPPAGSGPLLRWTVDNQSNAHGFLVWRAESEDGPLLRVNKELIKVLENRAGTYQWRDNSAVSGKTYWYAIGYVNIDGEKIDLSGRQKVTAK